MHVLWTMQKGLAQTLHYETWAHLEQASTWLGWVFAPPGWVFAQENTIPPSLKMYIVPTHVTKPFSVILYFPPSVIFHLSVAPLVPFVPAFTRPHNPLSFPLCSPFTRSVLFGLAGVELSLYWGLSLLLQESE